MTPSNDDASITDVLRNIADAISSGGGAGGLPSTEEASVGDVLSLDEDKKPTWAAPTGGGSFFGNKIFSGTVTDTPQPIEIRRDRFAAMPMYVGTINGEPINYMELHEEADGAYWDIRNNNNNEIRIRIGADGITIAAYYGDCEVELIDMGPRFVSVPGLLLQGVIHVHYPIFVLNGLAFAGCGLGLVVENSYAPIVFCTDPGGNHYFSAEIHIGSDYYSEWTVSETGDITGTTGGSNANN